MVHQYKSNGYNIVLDVNSGCVHVVDDLAYDVIALWEKSTPEEITAAMLEKYADQPDITQTEIEQVIADVRSLQEDGSLFSEDVYRDAVIDFKKRNAVVKALCLHVAHDCNLGCKAEHKDGEQAGHHREQLDLADYQLPGVPLVSGADRLAQKHRDSHGQAGDKAGEHLHDLAACGYGRGTFGGGELSYHCQVHPAVKGLQKEGEHKGKGEAKKRGKNGAG